MAVYQHDIQAAVDATSVAIDADDVDDVPAYLRGELGKRGITTSDREWLTRTADRIRQDPDVMVADCPDDFDPDRRRNRLA